MIDFLKEVAPPYPSRLTVEYHPTKMLIKASYLVCKEN